MYASVFSWKKNYARENTTFIEEIDKYYDSFHIPLFMSNQLLKIMLKEDKKPLMLVTK